jgi:hypothetical protein
MKKTLLLTVALTLLLAPVVFAQSTVVNPTRVEFIASADHNVTIPEIGPKLTGYEVEIVLQGATAPVQTVDIGKPTPNTDNLIVAPLSILLSIAMDTVYEAYVTAIGPGGRSKSEVSNPFLRLGAPAAPGQPTVAQ